MKPIDFLEESRLKHESVRSKPELVQFRIVETPENAERAKAHFHQGRVAWGAIVMANDALYHPGAIDLSGVVAYSFDPWFDAEPTGLSEIASAIRALQRTPSTDPSLSAFSAAIADHRPRVMDQIVPASLSNGREVRVETLKVQRDRLPTRYLADRLVPIIIDPAYPTNVILLPLAYWPEKMVARWKSAAAREASTRPIDAWLDNDQEFARQAITLTPNAAAQISGIIRGQGLNNPWLRVTAEHGAYGMDITETPPIRGKIFRVARRASTWLWTASPPSI